MAASVCCRRKVAAAKIEKLKAVIIKYYDISKTYSVQFQLNWQLSPREIPPPSQTQN